jgi:hypothetical protein
MRILRVACSATRMHWSNDHSDGKSQKRGTRTDLLNHIRAELLDGKGADIAGELAYYSVAESVVIQIQDILHNLEKQVNRRIQTDDVALT